MMPTLFQINTVVNWGSTGKIAEEIGRKAIQQEWQSYIAFGRNERESASNLIRIGSDLDFRLHVLQTRLRDDHGLGSRFSTLHLIRKIKEIEPDIIHLHNIHGYYLHYKLFFNFLKESGIPVIWTLHDCWPFTGHCAYYSKIQCDRWKNGCFSCPQRKTYPMSWVKDRSSQKFRDKKSSFLGLEKLTLVPVSHWLAQQLKMSYMKNETIFPIYNGVDIDVFKETKPVSNFCGKDEFLILGVASIWEERKGLQDFMQLASQLTEGERILLVGLSSEQIAQLPPSIIGIQRTENTRALVELYSTVDLFLNLTWEDNFPITNLEAMACGTPICTYETDGSVEAVTPETGFVVKQGDINGLLEVIRTVKSKGKRSYSPACRKRVVTHFNKQDWYQEYLDLYQQQLG